jgi:hypothetical protein
VSNNLIGGGSDEEGEFEGLADESERSSNMIETN